MKTGTVLIYSLGENLSHRLTVTKEGACDEWRAELFGPDGRSIYRGRLLPIDSAQHRAQLWALRNGISPILVPVKS